jgi:hypothetical protein
MANKNYRGSARGYLAGILAAGAIAAGTANSQDNFSGPTASAEVGNKGYRAEALFSGDNYFVKGDYLGGDDSGFEAAVGRNGALDVQLADQKAGDNNMVVAGLRERFNLPFTINSVTLNGYAGDVKGADLRFSFPMRSQKRGDSDNLNLDLLLEGYALKSKYNSANGAGVGVLGTYKLGKYAGRTLSLTAKVMGYTDEGLFGDQLVASAGLRLGSDENPAIEHYDLNMMTDGILKPAAEESVTATTPITTSNGNGSNGSETKTSDNNKPSDNNDSDVTPIQGDGTGHPTGTNTDTGTPADNTPAQSDGTGHTTGN